jgi:hypothetical protein
MKGDKNSSLPRDATGRRLWVGARAPRGSRAAAGYLASISAAGNGKLRRARKKLLLRGLEMLDKRGPVGKFYIATRQALIEQLGGREAVTPAQEHLIEIIVRGLTYLGHVDSVLLNRVSVVNKTGRNPKALPLLGERMAMSRVVAQQLQMLGFTRVTRLKSLAEELSQSPELLSKDGAPIPAPQEDET